MIINNYEVGLPKPCCAGHPISLGRSVPCLGRPTAPALLL